MIINSIMELHGKKSIDKKFTINIDKGYLAVATTFHDKRDRVVYAEPLENIDNILNDINNIWNFRKYTLIKKFKNELGIEILVDEEGNRILDYNRKEGKVTVYSQKGAKWFQKYDDWDSCVEYACSNHGCLIKTI